MKIYAIKDKKNGMIYNSFHTEKEAEEYLYRKSEKKPWIYDFVKIEEIEY